jgi:hypothetical protein
MYTLGEVTGWYTQHWRKYGTLLLFTRENLFHEYFIHQLGGREHLAIKLTTPAIYFVKIDDDCCYVMCDFVIWQNATFKYWTDMHLKYTLEQYSLIGLFKEVLIVQFPC